MKKVLCGAIGAAALVVAACSGGGGGGRGSPLTLGSSGSVAPVAAGGGGSVQMRFVILMPPGGAPVDVVSGDPTSGQKVLSGLQPGSVSDYVAVPTNGQTFLVSNGTTLSTLSYPNAGAQQTVAIGMDSSGSATSTEFVEQGGKVTATSGDVGTDSLDLPDGKALILGSGIGNASLADGLLIGQPGQGCLAGPSQSGDSKSTLGAQVDYFADPGPADLAFFDDLSCATPQTGSAHVTLTAGEMAYAFSWFADSSHLHLLFLPVQEGKSGKDGLVDSGDGPAYADSSGTQTDGATPSDSESSDSESPSDSEMPTE